MKLAIRVFAIVVALSGFAAAAASSSSSQSFRSHQALAAGMPVPTCDVTLCPPPAPPKPSPSKPAPQN